MMNLSEPKILFILEQVLDLNKTSYEDIVGRLKAFEERVLGEDSYEQPGNFLYANPGRRSELKRNRQRLESWSR